ncbi:MAG: D-alanyl-D-alanine carboxypeptidase, partial [Acidobacteriaceae bacterium]|nr:D-alanyl-D-alanine carboxypeptidase [Acidobacteriaceae bacterium]
MKTMQRRIRAVICGVAMASAWPLAMAQTVPVTARSAPPAAATQAPSATNSDAASDAASSAQSSPEQPSLAQQIAALLSAPAVARDHWGVIVTTLDGKPIYALNEAQLFQPASNAKLFTTAMAMALLGEDERFETQVVTSGQIDKQGILHGDLKLVGGGDASFGTNDLPYLPPAQRAKTTPPTSPTVIADIEELADKVYATGLRRIEGNVLGDDWRMIWEPYPSGWDLDDLVYGYGAPVSALSVHDNEIEVTTSPVVMINAGGHSSFPHAPVPTSPDLPYYSINNEVLHSWQDQPRDCDKYTAYQRAL